MPQSYDQLFSSSRLSQIFPEDRTNRFFEALFGDVDEGAYDIRLVYESSDENTLRFAFHLLERPEKCLTCSRTHGLPEVFKRHPIINLKGVVEAIDRTLNSAAKCGEWHLDKTREISPGVHAIPLVIRIDPAG